MTQNQITSIKDELAELKPSIDTWLANDVPEILGQIDTYKTFQVVDEETAKSAAEVISYCRKSKKALEEHKLTLLAPLIKIKELKNQELMKANTDLRTYEYFIDSKLSYFKEDVSGNKIIAKVKKDEIPPAKPRYELVSRFDYVESLVDSNYKTYLKDKMEKARIKQEQEMAEIRRQAEETKAKITKVAETPMQAISIEQNIDNAVALQETFLATLNKVPSTIKTAMGGIQTRKNYSISSVNKREVLKWVLDNPEHLDLLDINKVYANANFKPKAENNYKPLEVPGLVFDFKLSLIDK